MKKIYLISSILLLVTLTSCSYLKDESSNSNTTSQNMETSDVNMYEDDSMMESKENMMDLDSQNSKKDMTESIEKTMWMYSDYDMKKLAMDKDNIIFFHAWWCPACVKADKNFLSQEIPENLNILKIDYDNSNELKKKYWVTMQHTFVLVDKDWEMLKKWSGSSDIMDLEKQIK